MLIMGVDPGLEHMGIAFLDDGKPAGHNAFKTNKKTPHEDRLREIADEMDRQLIERRPNVVVVEDAFMYGPAKQGVKEVLMAIGVVEERVAEANRGRQESGKIGIVIYSPLQIKGAITGHATAPKDEVTEAVKRKIALPKEFGKTTSHVYDAYGAALTYTILRRG